MNFDRVKKYIYILSAVVLLGLLGFIAYQYFFAGRGAGEPTEGEATGRLPTTTDGLPRPTAGENRFVSLKPGEEFAVGEEQKLYRITDFPVISPALAKDLDEILFYKKDGGNLVSSDFTGKFQEELSNITILGMVKAVWSPARDRAAVCYIDLDQETLKGFLHVGTSSVTTLPANTRSSSWSPDGKSFAYLARDGDFFSLVITDSSGKKQKAEFRTPISDAYINWFAPNKISFHTAPSGPAAGHLFVWSRPTGAFDKIAGPLNGLIPLWSPDGKSVLVFSTLFGGSDIKLSVMSDAGKKLLETSLKTIPQKCVWASPQEIYCAVPSLFPPGATLPDDYLRGEINTSDRLMVLDLERETVSEIFGEGDFDMADLSLAQAKDWIFWVDRKDGSLWSLKLK